MDSHWTRAGLVSRRVNQRRRRGPYCPLAAEFLDSNPETAHQGPDTYSVSSSTNLGLRISAIRSKNAFFESVFIDQLVGGDWYPSL